MNAMSEIAPSLPPPGTLAIDRGESQRWTGALALVVGLHAIPALIAAFWLGPSIVLQSAEPTIMIDMAPLSAPPVRPSEQPPGPKQVKADSPQPRTERELVKTPDVPNAAVAIPFSPPEPPRVQAEAPVQQTTAPPATPAPPAPVLSGRVTWQGLVLGRLNRFKRYPYEAQVHRQQGVPWIRFVMDREGKVHSASLERSSGNATLDREAIALPRRAQPLPKPPADVTGETIELVAPVEFFMR